MRVVHALAGAHCEIVDGASNSVWTLAQAQAEQGHQVTVVLRERPTAHLTATHVAVVAWSDLVAVRAACRRADVLHAHSAFCPRLATVRRAVWGKVPVVVSPRGALARPVLRRHPFRKAVYAALVERPMVCSADLVLALTDSEARDVRRFAGPGCPPVAVVGNPIRPLPPVPAADRRSGEVVFLGRFDVQTKGLDRLAAVARRSSAVYRLYGQGGDGGAARFLAGLPDNVTVHPPVFGEHKAAVLSAAALYAQPSRWEAFGRSLAEAALAGTALVVSTECALAGQVATAGCGIVVDFERPDQAAATIDGLLAASEADRRAAMGRAAAGWAAGFSPELVAARTVEAYQRVG